MCVYIYIYFIYYVGDDLRHLRQTLPGPSTTLQRKLWMRGMAKIVMLKWRYIPRKRSHMWILSNHDCMMK